jgi:catechol 2,3-dioxygenase-like lactoylglutathione lyase family enzyme
VIAIDTLHHVGICVTDLARAKAFYGGVLGLRELPRPPFDFGGAWYQIGDCQLHLIVHPPTRTLRGTRDIDSRDGHLAIRVRSYDDTVQHLRSHGIECLESPRNLTPWAQIYVTDSIRRHHTLRRCHAKDRCSCRARRTARCSSVRAPWR